MSHPITREDMLDDGGAGRHLGQICPDEAHMVETACHYIIGGLRRGEAVIVMASNAHWAAFVGRLARECSVDVVDAVVNGQLRSVDAGVALAAVLEDGMPDRQRFEDLAGNLIERARKRFAEVRVYVELSNILLQKGNRAAAMRLEDLWNGLVGRLPFSLLCAYLASGRGVRGYNVVLKCVCDTHSHLVPSPGGNQASPKANALKQGARIGVKARWAVA